MEDLLLYWRCRYCYWGCIGNIVIDCENGQVACSRGNTALGLGRAIPGLGFRALDFLTYIEKNLCTVNYHSNIGLLSRDLT